MVVKEIELLGIDKVIINLNTIIGMEHLTQLFLHQPEETTESMLIDTHNLIAAMIKKYEPLTNVNQHTLYIETVSIFTHLKANAVQLERLCNLLPAVRRKDNIQKLLNGSEQLNKHINNILEQLMYQLV